MTLVGTQSASLGMGNQVHGSVGHSLVVGHFSSGPWLSVSSGSHISLTITSTSSASTAVSLLSGGSPSLIARSVSLISRSVDLVSRSPSSGLDVSSLRALSLFKHSRRNSVEVGGQVGFRNHISTNMRASLVDGGFNSGRLVFHFSIVLMKSTKASFFLIEF